MNLCYQPCFLGGEATTIWRKGRNSFENSMDLECKIWRIKFKIRAQFLAASADFIVIYSKTLLKVNWILLFPFLHADENTIINTALCN